MELSEEKRKSNIGAIRCREAETGINAPVEFGKLLVEQPGPKRFISVIIGANTFHIASITVAPDINKNMEKKSRRETAQSIWGAIRLPNMPDASFDELVSQAERSLHYISLVFSSNSMCYLCFTQE